MRAFWDLPHPGPGRPDDRRAAKIDAAADCALRYVHNLNRINLILDANNTITMTFWE